ADFDIPGRLNGAPALLKLNGIGLGKMGFGIALHVNRAELDVGVGKEPLAGHQTGKVVLNENHHTAETAFNESPQNPFPVFNVFTAGLGDTTQDAFLAISAQTDHQVDAGRTELIALAQFDVLAVDEDG